MCRLRCSRPPQSGMSWSCSLCCFVCCVFKSKSKSKLQTANSTAHCFALSPSPLVGVGAIYYRLYLGPRRHRGAYISYSPAALGEKNSQSALLKRRLGPRPAPPAAMPACLWAPRARELLLLPPPPQPKAPGSLLGAAPPPALPARHLVGYAPWRRGPRGHGRGPGCRYWWRCHQPTSCWESGSPCPCLCTCRTRRVCTCRTRRGETSYVWHWVYIWLCMRELLTSTACRVVESKVPV
jgi:hypothetical protein